MFIQAIGLAVHDIDGIERYYLLTEEVEDETLNDADAVLRCISPLGEVLWKQRYFSNDLNEIPHSLVINGEEIVLGM
ncbi:hypothetical protein RZS08_31565, partial [Arthrospira platensis SPKY1]|nr:hypothetical protein [Arthrospira platensis SPKY1]